MSGQVKCLNQVEVQRKIQKRKQSYITTAGSILVLVVFCLITAYDRYIKSNGKFDDFTIIILLAGLGLTIFLVKYMVDIIKLMIKNKEKKKEAVYKLECSNCSYTVEISLRDITLQCNHCKNTIDMELFESGANLKGEMLKLQSDDINNHCRRCYKDISFKNAQWMATCPKCHDEVVLGEAPVVSYCKELIEPDIIA